jgi:hypothetical protein
MIDGDAPIGERWQDFQTGIGGLDELGDLTEVAGDEPAAGRFRNAWPCGR